MNKENIPSQELSPPITAVKSVQSHTPGPWEIIPSRASSSRCIYAADGYGIGEAWDVNGEPQNEANAHLIAAAPEMFEYIASSASNGCATAQALIAQIEAK